MTLAKLANRVAKSSGTVGPSPAINLLEREDLDALLADFPVGDVWGVGPGLRKTLQVNGIATARQLRDADTFWIKSEFGVTGLAIVLELRQQVCHVLNENPARKLRREIIVSRTFRNALQGINALAPAMSEMAAHAATRLATSQALTQLITVFVETDYFGKAPHSGSSVELEMEVPTASADDIAYYTQQALAKIVDERLKYKKGGVILGTLRPVGMIQETLFSSSVELESEPELDASKTVAGDQPGRSRHTLQRAEFESNHYTTQWEQIPVIR